MKSVPNADEWRKGSKESEIYVDIINGSPLFGWE